jgi:hypothetical protein
MRPFESKGVWWLPDTPTDQVPGVLSYSQADGSRLSLSGSLGRRQGDLPSFPVIHGIVEGGKAATLLESFAVKSSLGGVASTEIFSHFSLRGAHTKALSQQSFQKISIVIDSLAQWAAFTPLSSKLEFVKNRLSRIEVAYAFPKSRVYRGQTATYTVGSGFKTHGDMRHNVEIETHVSLTIRLPKYQLLPGCLERVTDIQLMLALATDYPCSVERCRLFLRVPRTKQPGTWQLAPVDLCYQPLYIASNPGRAPHPSEFLFFLSSLQPDAGSAFDAWHLKRADLDSAFALFFRACYGDGMTLDRKALYYLQAAETFHRRRLGGCSLPETEHQKRLNEVLAGAGSHRRWLEDKLQYSNELSLRKRLQELLRRVPPVTADLVKNKSKFVQLALYTRNYLTHFDRRLEKKAASGRRLYELSEILRYLTVAQLLLELDLSTTAVHHALRKSLRYQDAMSFDL